MGMKAFTGNQGVSSRGERVMVHVVATRSVQRAAWLAALFLAPALAGCSDAAPEVYQDLSTTDPQWPGIVFRAVITGQGHDFHARLSAENAGTQTVEVAGGCPGPFTYQVRDPQGEVHGMPGPQPLCASYFEAFAPGDRRDGERTWDATLGPDVDRAHVADGTYTWILLFHLADDEASQPMRIEVPLPVG